MSSALPANDAIASGYGMGHTWCRRCDVGWTSFERACWLCDREDMVWRWDWVNAHPIFFKQEPLKLR